MKYSITSKISPKESELNIFFMGGHGCRSWYDLCFPTTKSLVRSSALPRFEYLYDLLFRLSQLSFPSFRGNSFSDVDLGIVSRNSFVPFFMRRRAPTTTEIVFAFKYPFSQFLFPDLYICLVFPNTFPAKFLSVCTLISMRRQVLSLLSLIIINNGIVLSVWIRKSNNMKVFLPSVTSSGRCSHQLVGVSIK